MENEWLHCNFGGKNVLEVKTGLSVSSSLTINKRVEYWLPCRHSEAANNVDARDCEASKALGDINCVQFL
jgi:hypothetical protein